MKLFIAIFSLVAFSGVANADQSAQPLPTPDLYACHVILVAADLPDGSADANFDAVGLSQESHGGKEYPFTFGPYMVTVISNARWMGVAWKKGNTMIAQTVTARAEDRHASEVVIAYNPANADESAAIECSPKKLDLGRKN